MFTFDIFQHVPEFILRDKNGYAVARAIEAAINYINDHAKKGLDAIYDVDSMSEERLDEMAWELNCLYEYNGSIEQKREWIREARPLYRIWGTVDALQKYLNGYFENVEVEENWFYGGDPYHFRIFVEGGWNPSTEAWTKNAVERAKNTRSVLDNIAIGCISYIGMSAEGFYKKFPYPFANQYKAGEKPIENIIAIIDRSNNLAMRDDTISQKFPYEITGVYPDINMIGIIDKSNNLGIRDDTVSMKFPYEQAGTSPEVNVIGVIDSSGKAGMSGEVRGQAFQYSMANESDRSGVKPQDSLAGVLDNSNIQSATADDFYMTIPYRMCGVDEL
jgi:hypothetical protein